MCNSDNTTHSSDTNSRSCEMYRQLRACRRIIGICVKCGKEPSLPNIGRCQACKDKNSTKLKSIRKERIDKGLCARCGMQPIATGSSCIQCHNAAILNEEIRRAWRIKQGMCLRCGKRPPLPGLTRCQQCTDRYANISIKCRSKLRNLVMRIYSGDHPKCACCGEDNPLFLTIDHINGGGKRHRDEIGRSRMYQWLKNNNFPPGYQILCSNCNMGRSNNSEQCPHLGIIPTVYKNKQSQHQSIRQNTLRDQVLAAYSNKCACCGETTKQFLHIDHVNGLDQKKRIHITTLCKRIIEAGYPDTYRILCANCNCGRELNNGICPHINHKITKEEISK